MSGGFLLQAVVYLGAAVLCVPVAKRMGMGSVLGYLIAGILIGPFVMGFIGTEGEDILHFAEFGVVMMLFLIGLELEPKQFWRMRRSIVGMGASQMVVTTALLFAGGLVMGFEWQAALAGGMALSMSSTAIVLQTVKEKGLMNTSAGQSSFSVLLFQDIAVIPMLAALPLLASGATADNGHGGAHLLENLPGWAHALAVFGAVLVIIAAGKFVIGPLLHIVARTRLRELFSASALLIVMSISYLMELVGLSHALGAFLAGVVLANSEYKHALESDLEPFKGLLLGLFFIAVGASIDFSLIAANPGTIAMLVLIIMPIKALVLFGIGKVFKLDLDQNMLFALGLSQVGEFAFVLLSFIGQLSIFSSEWISQLMAVVAISMTITPLLLLVNDKFIRPNFGVKEEEELPADVIDQKCPVIIAGFAHFGSTVGRLLRANGVEATILDFDSDRVAFLRKMGFKVFYGDATRVDLLESAGASEAKILISGIDSPETNRELVKTVRAHFPHLKVMVRAKNRWDAYELIEMGENHIYRESLDTAIRLGVDVLKQLGIRAHTAQRAGHLFRKHDEEAMQKLAPERHNKQEYILRSRQQIEWQEELIREDSQIDLGENDHAWDTEPMREIAYKR
ncbi:MAG: monovalent cation:proton antiporter-2 (CPA2) family protein [Bacteroidota bacterium]